MAPSSRQSAEGTDDGDRGTGGTRPSKLRHSLKFTWNHSVASPSGSGVKPESQSDAAYEVSYPLIKAFYSKYLLLAGLNFWDNELVQFFQAANLLMNVSFWMMKHAAAVAAKDDLQMEEAKEVRSFNAINFLWRCQNMNTLRDIILKIHILGSHCLTESVRFDSFCEGHSYPSAIGEARRGYGLGLQGHFSIPQSVHSRGSGKGFNILFCIGHSRYKTKNLSLFQVWPLFC